MKIRVKVSRSQLQEMMMKDHEERDVLLRKLYHDATDQTVCMDHESLDSSVIDPSSSRVAGDKSNRQTLKRSSSLRRLLLRRDIKSHEEVQTIHTYSAKDCNDRRVFGRSGSLKVLVARKNSSDDVFQDQPATRRSSIRRRKSSRKLNETSNDTQIKRSMEDQTRTKPRRSASKSRPSRENTPRARSKVRSSPKSKTRVPSPKTPKTPVTPNSSSKTRRSLRSRSFSLLTPKLAMPLFQQREQEKEQEQDDDLELFMQESFSPIRELDELLASKSPAKLIQSQMQRPSHGTPSCSTTSSSDALVNSRHGALAHVTTGREKPSRTIGRSKSCQHHGEDSTHTTSSDILNAYDYIMEESLDVRSILDINTGW
ncbi:hypothetical protein MPSEU_000910900 [Mayamaea pseudoterrestris]|nr:hypothetical protein MPSEU_000910900 [Mayamaea pseudoterrestris]